MPNEGVNVCVDVDPKVSLIVGRNGERPIEFVEVWAADDRAFVDGIGKRGSAIRGGLMFPTKTMDEIAREWLKARGLGLEDEL